MTASQNVVISQALKPVEVIADVVQEQAKDAPILESKPLSLDANHTDEVPVEVNDNAADNVVEPGQHITKFFEKVNKKHIDYLLDFHRADLTIYERSNLDNMRRRIHKDTGLIKVLYDHATEGGGFGRLYANTPSLQKLSKKVRGFVAGEHYQDIDICNSIPCITWNICKKYAIDCPHLEEYCLNRQQVLEKYSVRFGQSKSNIKDAILSCIFGMAIENLEYKMRGDIKKDEYLLGLKKEIHGIAKHLLLNKHFKACVKAVRTAKQQANSSCDNKTLLSYITATEENKILQCMVRFFNAREYFVGVLFYDGCWVESDKPLDRHWLVECEEQIQKELGYDIKLACKPIETTFEYDESKYAAKENVHYIKHDLEAVQVILKDIHSFVRRDKDGEFWLKDEDSHTWQCNEKNLRSDLVRHIQNMDIQTLVSESKDGKTVGKVYSRRFATAKALAENVMTNMPYDRDFKDKLFYSNLQKLAFLNGYWDFRKRVFVPWTEMEKSGEEVYFIHNANRYFKWDEDFAEIKSLLSSFMANDEGELDHMLKLKARALAGHYEDKTWVLIKGVRNSGKGMWTELDTSAFGDYVETLEADCLLRKKNKDADSEKANAWIRPFLHTRLLVSNEIPSDQPMAGALLKKITGGGDEIKMRSLYAKTAFKSRIQFTLFVGCNPSGGNTADQGDCFENCQKFDMPYKYVTAKEKNTVENRGKVNWKVGDPRLKTRIRDDDHLINSYITYLFTLYTAEAPAIPEFVMRQRDEDLGEDASELNAIKRVFTFTNNPDDIMPAKLVQELMKEVGIASRVYGTYLRNEACQRTSRRIDGVVTSVWNSLKRKPKEPAAEKPGWLY